MSVVGHSQVQALPEQWKGLIRCGKHEFFTDEPEHLEGQNQGAAPYDLLCSSLVACTMITLRMYAKHKGIDLGEFSVSAEFLSHRDGLEHIQRHVTFEQPLNDELRQKLLAVCQKTPVTKTLLRSVAIETQIFAPVQ
ncbi:OsmC family protein [Acinetobacter sp. MB5]|uniref:OsmC family protein n=1 Tax=Acinetobacter sp. MB5 TaxID=2069438 RepID=UPI000DCFA72B|nr:OsmC family protein [Acinetobacter sp. MB5]